MAQMVRDIFCFGHFFFLKVNFLNTSPDQNSKIAPKI